MNTAADRRTADTLAATQRAERDFAAAFGPGTQSVLVPQPLSYFTAWYVLTPLDLLSPQEQQAYHQLGRDLALRGDIALADRHLEEQAAARRRP